jgi:hypothetical protein
MYDFIGKLIQQLKNKLKIYGNFEKFFLQSKIIKCIIINIEGNQKITSLKGLEEFKNVKI